MPDPKALEDGAQAKSSSGDHPGAAADLESAASIRSAAGEHDKAASDMTLAAEERLMADQNGNARKDFTGAANESLLSGDFEGAAKSLSRAAESSAAIATGLEAEAATDEALAQAAKARGDVYEKLSDEVPDGASLDADAANEYSTAQRSFASEAKRLSDASAAYTRAALTCSQALTAATGWSDELRAAGKTGKPAQALGIKLFVQLSSYVLAAKRCHDASNGATKMATTMKDSAAAQRREAEAKKKKKPSKVQDF